MKKIALASDHAAVDLKQHIKNYLDSIGMEYVDYGPYTAERCDYPVYGLKAAEAIVNGECDGGIVFCGTGVGISLAANKVKGIRCCVCSDCYSARMSREHNDANMLSLGARVVGCELAVDIVKAWLEAEFDTEFMGGCHVKRVNMIKEIENTGKIG